MPVLKLKSIALSDLRVNRANDRHGELLDENTAIAWLLDNRGAHMRKLTQDIVTSSEVFEPPLVREDGGFYIVYDGNRRTTVLKLLADPSRAPDENWQKFFSDQRASWSEKFPRNIQCQVEDDLERLDQILIRRHTGVQDGIGQTPWDQSAKRNFVRRTGFNADIDVAEEIERILKEAGHLDVTESIKRSNLNRLLSTEKFWGRLGLRVDGNELRFTHNQDKVIDALTKIVDDLAADKIVLKDVWKNEDKERYLNRLQRQGFLPTQDDALPLDVKPEPKKTTASKKGKEKSSKRRPERRHLIRDHDLEIPETHETRRARDIIHELQHDLVFGQHDNAIAVLFRVVLEIAIEVYTAREKVDDIVSNEKLSNRFKKVLAHMLGTKKIDKNYHDALKKFDKQEPVFSAHTLNAYVHNDNYFPSDHHLSSMWDTVERYIVVCLGK